MTPKFELYFANFSLAKKYAGEKNYELAYLAMLDAATALLDDFEEHLQDQLATIEKFSKPAES